MKNGKRILAVLMIALMLLSLSACGFADIPVIKAVVEFAQLSSVHAEPEFELGMKINVPSYGMNMDIAITADGQVDYCADPLSFSADLSLNALDENQHVLAYGEDVDGDFVVWYSTDDGLTWEQDTVGKTAEINADMDKVSSMSLSDLIDAGKQLGDVLSGFEKVGKERVNGAGATRYDAAFRFSAIADNEEMSEAFLGGVGESLDMDASAVAELADPAMLKDMQLSVWLDDAGSRLVKAQIDMSETMRALFESGLMDSLISSEAGLEDVEYSVTVETMRLAVTFSQFNGIGSITRPSGAGSATGVIGGADGPTSVYVTGDAALTEGSTWHGSYEISNHAGKGALENGSTEVWGLLGSSGGQLFFELYTEPDFSGSAKPILSYWAELDGDSIVPVIGDNDAWFLNVYLEANDADSLRFTLRDGELRAQYFYYDASAPEACDVSFALSPIA